MLNRVVLGCVLAAGLAAACGGDDGDDTGGGGDGGTPPATECTDTYNNYAKSFFATNCNACHSTAAYMTLGAKYALDSLAAVKEHEDHVIEHAVDLKIPVMPQTMPMGLPQAERTRLKQWYDCGAKE